MLDLVIRNATVIDGTGSAGFKADIAIEGDRIVAVGMVDKPAKREIDAAGKIAAPGFIDIHTHYDAQVFWDRLISPSCFHGVTTIIGGNCGFSIAPLNGNADDAAYLMRMLARVEGMPLESLQTGVPWNWTSFDDYLALLEGQLAINAGFMVGHSAIRRHVMGSRAVGEKATEAEIADMQQLLRASLAAGGFGFSSTVSPSHNDGEGNPVPSRHASDEEIYALASVVGEFEGTAIEFLPNAMNRFDESQMERMTRVSLAAGRPLNWNVLLPDSTAKDRMENQLAASDYAAKRGAKVYALASCEPPISRLNFVAGFGFDGFPGWSGLFKMTLAERMEILAQPLVRRLLEEGASTASGVMQRMSNWGAWHLHETFTEEYKAYEGKTLDELSESKGCSPFNAMLDLVLADKLRTVLVPPVPGGDEESWLMRGAAWLDDRTIIGASDAGAHLDMLSTFAFTTTVLGEGVRRRKLLTLEQAVHQLTGVPAAYLGLRGRGTIAPGMVADIVVFDAATIDCGPVHTRFDLPAGAARLYADAEGIEHVIVNGTEIIRDGAFLGHHAGKILRSGRDSATVSIPATKAA